MIIPRTKTARRRALAVLAITACVGLSVGGYHAFWHANLKRFQEVRPGVFYRSGLASQWGLDYAVERYGIKTIVTALPEDPVLKKSWFDPGRPSGPRESTCAAAYGLNVVRLPMGDEACWPWPTPWEFEEFFATCDERSNWPLLLHCVGGRHRTGVLSALYRLEYDRWEIQPTLDEMYSFEFGLPQTVSEHNLRTYVRRPRPNADQWKNLLKVLGPALPQSPADYENLVYQLQRRGGDAKLEASLAAYLREHRTFALPLAARVLRPGEPPFDEMLARSAELVRESTSAASSADDADPQVAAAWIADYGTPQQQQGLLDALQQGQQSPQATSRYHALACGVLNRYTRNRLPFWQVILVDRRRRIDKNAPGRRYCDTVAARLSVLIDQALVSGNNDEGWNRGVAAAEAWYASHASDVQLTQLIPPEGHKGLAPTAPAIVEEDLSRMRR